MRTPLNHAVELGLFLGALLVLVLVLAVHADVVVPERDILAAVRDCARRGVEKGQEAEISCRWRGDLRVEGTGSVRLRATPASVEGSGGGIPVELEVLRGGRTVRNLLITADIAYFDTVAVAARQLRHGDALSPDAVRFERREVTQMLERTFSLPEELEGLQMRATLSPGRVLDRRLTEGATVVRRGEAVTVLAEVGTITITTSGRAMSDGAFGACIFVENSDRQRIQGRVVRAGVVKIVF